MLLHPPQSRLVLGGDHHHVFLHIFNRMVAAVVTKFHFDSLRTARQRQQLMTRRCQYRNIGFEEFLDGGNGVIARGRVRTVGEEDAVWIHFQHIFRRNCSPERWSGDSLYPPASAGCCAWHQNHKPRRGTAARLLFRFWQAAGQRPAPLCPAIGFCGGHFFCQIHR